MKNIEIMKTIKRIPGGLLIIPMAISAILNAFFPNLFKIGDPTEVLFSSGSTMVITGMLLFIAGTQIDLSKVGASIKKALFLVILKLGLAFAFGIVVINLPFSLSMLSSLVIVTVLFSTNPGFYLAVSPSKKDDENQVIFALLSFVVMPAIPILVFQIAEGGSIDATVFLSTFVPLFLGLMFRFLDSAFGDHFKPGTNVLMPFLGFSFGFRIDLGNLASQIIPGVLLVIIYYVFIVLPMFFLERKVLKDNGKSSLTMGVVAGMSMSVPILANAANADTIIAQISVAVVLSTIMTPILTRLLVKD